MAIESATPGALRRLTAYRWPGNVRELEAVLELLAEVAEGVTYGNGVRVKANPATAEPQAAA